MNRKQLETGRAMTEKKMRSIWIERQRRYTEFQDGIDMAARDKHLAEIDKINRQKLEKGRAMTERKNEILWIERQRRYAEFQDGIDMAARDKHLAEIDKINRQKLEKGRLMTEKKVRKEREKREQITEDFNPPAIDLNARKKQRLDLDKEMAGYRGEQIDLKAMVKKRNENMETISEFRGDIKAFKASDDMHPSVKFRTAGESTSVARKQRYQKRMYKKLRNSEKDLPPFLKDKLEAPKYSKEEAEIWYD